MDKYNINSNLPSLADYTSLVSLKPSDFTESEEEATGPTILGESTITVEQPTPLGNEVSVRPSDTPPLSTDYATVIDNVADFIEQFVFLKNRSLYLLISLWVVLTHKYQLFDCVGYIFAHSINPASGKSRLLEVLDLLVYNSSGILISPTEAILFRTACGATQLLDELDSLISLDYLKSVLNAGFQKGSTVPRMEGKDGGWVPKKFPVFAPRALAGINKKILPQPTLDRTFDFDMVPQTKE